MGSTVYFYLNVAAFPKGRARSLILFPIAIIFDIVLLNYSMWKYEFSEVDWKGRRV
jgi:hypothetical protein